MQSTCKLKSEKCGVYLCSCHVLQYFDSAFVIRECALILKFLIQKLISHITGFPAFYVLHTVEESLIKMHFSDFCSLIPIQLKFVFITAKTFFLNS